MTKLTEALEVYKRAIIDRMWLRDGSTLANLCDSERGATAMGATVKQLNDAYEEAEREVMGK